MPRKSAGILMYGKYWDWMNNKASAIEAFDYLLDHGYVIWWSDESQRIFIRRSKKSEPYRIPSSGSMRLQKELQIDSRERLEVLKRGHHKR